MKYKNHEKNIISNILQLIVILVFPYVFLFAVERVVRHLIDGVNPDNILEDHFKLLEGNWLSALGVIATIIISFNVLQGEISKELHLKDSKELKLTNDDYLNGKTNYYSYFLVNYYIATLISGIFLVFIAYLNVMFIKNSLNLLFLTAMLNLVCAVNLSIWWSKLKFSVKVNSLPNYRRTLRFMNESVASSKSKNIVISWRCAMFYAVFIAYLWEVKEPSVALLSTLIFFISHLIIRCISAIGINSPYGVGVLVTFLLVCSLSFLSFIVFVLVGVGQHSISTHIEVYKSPLLEFVGFEINYDLSNWTIYLLYALILILIFIDIFAYANVSTFFIMRYRAIYEFTENAGGLAVTLEGMLCNAVAVVYSCILFNDSKFQGNGIYFIVLYIIFSKVIPINVKNRIISVVFAIIIILTQCVLLNSSLDFQSYAYGFEPMMLSLLTVLKSIISNNQQYFTSLFNVKLIPNFRRIIARNVVGQQGHSEKYIKAIYPKWTI